MPGLDSEVMSTGVMFTLHGWMEVVWPAGVGEVVVGMGRNLWVKL
jgi:hypothetical protein